MYTEYKRARDVSWQTLIDCGITSLPVNLTAVTNHYGIDVIKYASLGVDGLYIVLDGRRVICLSNKAATRTRRRYTIAHELGHYLLDTPAAPAPERISDIYARDLLAPACVIAALRLHTAEDIMRLCDISRQAAEIRAERMAELYRRNMFGAHPLERQVMRQFEGFVATRARCDP